MQRSWQVTASKESEMLHLCNMKGRFTMTPPVTSVLVDALPAVARLAAACMKPYLLLVQFWPMLPISSSEPLLRMLCNQRRLSWMIAQRKALLEDQTSPDYCRPLRLVLQLLNLGKHLEKQLRHLHRHTTRSKPLVLQAHEESMTICP